MPLTAAAPALTTPHVRQTYSWDCGLACVASVLANNRKSDSSETAAASAARHHAALTAAATAAASDAALADTTVTAPPSVWTIDLAIILLNAGLSPRYFTTEPAGANPGHAAMPFYSATFARDEQRVRRLFAEGRARGLRVIEGSVPDAYMPSRLIDGSATVFIVLLDLRWLQCRDCADGGRESALPLFSYAGHYVVVTGYRPADDEFEFMDPAKPGPRCFMASSLFHRARRSTGTDEDILEILF